MGTRASRLALTQTQSVVDRLRQRYPDLTITLVPITTRGDRDHQTPFERLGESGLFVKELQRALLGGAIDLAVHSLKDLPVAPQPGLEIAAVPLREDARDALVSATGQGLFALPAGARVGTSSPRRSAQVRAARPDLQILPLRGNLDTRLRRLEAGEYDAIIVAAAGLHRLGWADRITEYLPFEVCLPAVGQGALAVEARAGDPAAILARTLTDPLVEAAVRAERALLAALGGGCHLPIAAYATPEGDTLYLRALIAQPDGRALVRAEGHGPRTAPETLGQTVARRLLASGGADLLAARPSGRG